MFINIVFIKNNSVVVTTTDYGDTNFVSIIAENNILGVQFHPEKSQDIGKLLIKNFIKTFHEKKRLIPIVLLRNGWVVQSIKFKEYKNLGNPHYSVKRLSEWCSDELIYLDITSDDGIYDMRRNDIKSNNHTEVFSIIDDIAKSAFMPLCF